MAAAVARATEERAAADGAWQAPWRLLHAMASMGGPALRAATRSALAPLGRELRQEIGARPQPSWLRRLPRIGATGEVWRMRDIYGARFAVIAAYTYPGGREPSVFLFDIDACGIPRLAHAGAFDDLESAATAWRALVGDSADGVLPTSVETTDGLAPLVYCDPDGEMLRGDETRRLLDNWFRARRRMDNLADALRRRGTPLPTAVSLYHDIDAEPMATEFVGWHTRRHGTEPSWDAAYALAGEWMEGSLPETWHAASPHRAEYQLALISDWMDDDVTTEVKALFPEWFRWHGEQAGLPEPFISRAVAVASGAPRTPLDCLDLSER